MQMNPISRSQTFIQSFFDVDNALPIITPSVGDAS
jgi:hypothetical protein